MGDYFSASRLKKRLQPMCTFLSQHTALHYRTVIEAGRGQHIEDRARGTSDGIGGAVDYPGHPGVHHGAGTHGAGFQSDIQTCTRQAVVGQTAGGGAHESGPHTVPSPR